MFDSLIILSKKFKDLLKELDDSSDYPGILDELDALTPQKLSNFLSAGDHQIHRGSTDPQVASHLLDLVARIAISDGELSDAEAHDLDEIALAVCCHLHVNGFEEVVTTMNDNLRNWKKESENDPDSFKVSNEQGFKHVAKQINNDCSTHEKRQILRLCNQIARSDGKIDSDESRLLSIANDCIKLSERIDSN